MGSVHTLEALLLPTLVMIDQRAMLGLLRVMVTRGYLGWGLDLRHLAFLLLDEWV